MVPSCAGRAVEGTPDRVEVADVRGDADDVAAGCPQRGRGGVDVRLLAAGDGHVRAVLREVLGDPEADAGGAAEDEDVLSGEVHCQRHGDRSLPIDMVMGSSGKRRRAPRPAPIPARTCRCRQRACARWPVPTAVGRRWRTPCRAARPRVRRSPGRRPRRSVSSTSRSSPVSSACSRISCAVDDQREQLPEHQPEVQVQLLIGVRGRGAASGWRSPSACSRNTRDVGQVGERRRRPVASREA